MKFGTTSNYQISFFVKLLHHCKDDKDIASIFMEVTLMDGGYKIYTVIFREDIEEEIYDKEIKVYLVVVDVETAFDCADREELLRILRTNNAENEIVESVLEKMLWNIKFGKSKYQRIRKVLVKKVNQARLQIKLARN